MGAGNWSARSRDFETSVIHVDDLRESFADYRAHAEEAFKQWLVKNHPSTTVLQLLGVRPGAAEEFTGSVIAWAKENGLQDYLEEALSDDYPVWDNENAFAQDQSEDRFNELTYAIRLASKQALPTAEADADQLKQAIFDADRGAMVLALGQYAQVVIRHWESYLYLGVAPKNEVDNEGHFITKGRDPTLTELLGRCWAICDPDNNAFARYRAPGRDAALVELRPSEIGLRHGDRVDARLLQGVVDRIVERAQQLDAANDQPGMKQFKADFGIEVPHLLSSKKNVELDVHIEFVSQFNATPAMVVEGYERELNILNRAILDCMASLSEKPLRPDTAWTSKVVDLSGYRHVVAVQVGAEQIDALQAQKTIDVAMSSAAACQISLMPENVFDRTVTGAIQQRYPYQELIEPGGLELHLRSAGDRDGGVVVWRGHRDWLATDMGGQQSAWLREKGSARLGELPAWMSLATDSSEIRETLDALAVPAAVGKGFFSAEGDLEVTGVLVEVRDGDYGSAHVTYSSRPFGVDATFETVLLNGEWNAPIPAPEKEFGHE